VCKDGVILLIGRRGRGRRKKNRTSAEERENDMQIDVARLDGGVYSGFPRSTLLITIFIIIIVIY